jgi:ubiquinone/menaquinone biosynthesis C-methylase UbiE
MQHQAPSTPNPFEAPAVAARYEDWYSGPGCHADDLERRLLGKLLAGFPQARSVIDIGCGTGHFTRWAGNKGLTATGLDASKAMLAEARRLDGVEYLEGNALELPFGDRAFDLAMLVTTLEFVADPLRALSEAARVARQGLLLGVLNRHSLVARGYRASGKSLWHSAHFFTPWELSQLVRQAAETRLRRLSWRTTLWPLPLVRDLPLPWGGFIGLAAQLEGP